MDWFVDAVAVPATFGSGTGKDPTKRKRKGVSTAAIRGAARRSWNNPKQKKMMLAGEGKSGSVCLSRSSLWSAGRPNNIPSPPFVPCGRSAKFPRRCFCSVLLRSAARLRRTVRLAAAVAR